jgi:maltooligosyltrehalose trehalohydrolase
MRKELEHRRLPIGAEIFKNKGVHFRVWAPIVDQMDLILEALEGPEKTIAYPLIKDEHGYFSGLVPKAKAGSLYRFKIHDQEMLFPDPASRFQPEGPHGPSQVINPAQFQWNDDHWQGLPDKDRVIYEMHIGTFTGQGNWQSAKRELLELADLGITIIEMMPVNEFPGKFGWGYDGVNLFAPSHLYGNPDDLRDFINQAHCLGIAVILDVVYNHFGPDGNYLHAFAPHYFTHDYTTEWGDAINFDGPDSQEVRSFFINNAGYWIDEFHFDGLRLDATQNIYDRSEPHILTEISNRVHKIAGKRKTYIVGENEKQETRHVLSTQEGGYGMDAVWNDDFHHSAMVRLIGRREAYYTDYLGTPQEFISAIKYGYLFQGQWYCYQNKKRGTSSFHLSPDAFITFIQNHDQIANSAHGLRIHQLSDPGNYRAMTALMLLAPSTPLLFQGQEFAASSPFYYFADHNEELAALVFKGRKDYFKQFPSIATPEIQALLPMPAAEETFQKSKLNFLDRAYHHQEYNLHRDLLKIRKNDPVISSPKISGIDGAVLNQDAFLIRFFGDEHEDTRLLIINFGSDFNLSPAPEPLLAAPESTTWSVLWSSEDSRYGGGGTPPLSTDQHWGILGHSAILLIPQRSEH